MPETIVKQPGAIESPSRVETTQKYLGLVYTSLGIAGAIGTIFVWLAANFYVGDVEIRDNGNVDSLTVRVFDRRGQEYTYHGRKFQLMPGDYHFEVTVPEGPAQKFDASVRFNELTVLSVAAGSTGQKSGPSRRWWQFWRR